MEKARREEDIFDFEWFDRIIKCVASKQDRIANCSLPCLGGMGER
jgi:hypothetical protein